VDAPAGRALEEERKMLRRLDNVGIAVRDVKRVVDFYVTKLGFQGDISQER